MEKPIIVSFRWSAQEMLLAQRLHMRYSAQGRKLRRAFIVALVVFLILPLASILQHQNFFASALPFLAIVIILLCMPLFMRKAVLKVYAQKADRDMVVTYQITTDRIATKSEVATAEMLWRTIMRVHRVPEGFFFYPNDRNFHWLPVRGFQDPTDIERLAQIAKASVPQYESSV